MDKTTQKTQKRIRRHQRIRAQVSGTGDMPRFSVFRSNRALYAQLIDDEKGSTLLSVKTDAGKGTLIERARAAGKKLAEEAKGKGITKVVFDRGGFIYTGNIRAFAEGAREGGLTF